MGPLGGPAVAQEKFPAREVNWIIYQAPGGSIDTTARIIQPYLEKAGGQDQARICAGRGRTRRAHASSSTARPDGYTMMTESAPGGAIDEVIGRAELQGERLHSDLRLERDQLAALREEGFADPDLPAVRRRMQKAPRGGRHHRALGVEPYPARRAAEGIEPAVRHGAFRGLRQSLSGGAWAAMSTPRSAGRHRARACATACISSASPAREREKALPDVPTLEGAGLRGHAHRSDLVRDGHAQGAGGSDRDPVQRLRQGVRGQDAVGADAEGRRASRLLDPRRRSSRWSSSRPR